VSVKNLYLLSIATFIWDITWFKLNNLFFFNSPDHVIYCHHFISPLPTKSKGTIGLHSVRLSVCPADQFSALFFVVLADIDLIFGIYLNYDKLQIKFEFRSGPMIFGWVMALGRRKFTQIISFPHFFLSCLQILIWYLVYSLTTIVSLFIYPNLQVMFNIIYKYKK